MEADVPPLMTRRALADRISAQAKGEFDQLACCFLELAEPLIPDAIDQLVREGATRLQSSPTS